MESQEKTYQLFQVMRDPRDGKYHMIMFDSYDNRCEAEFDAERLAGRWAIFESKLISSSPEMDFLDH